MSMQETEGQQRPEQLNTPERITPKLNALQGRLFVGGDALNPANTALGEFTPQQFENPNPEVLTLFNTLSDQNRQEVWNAKAPNQDLEARKETWKAELKATFTDTRSQQFFETNEGRRYRGLFQAFSRAQQNQTIEDEAEQLYQNYFDANTGEAQIEKFIADTLTLHTQNGQFNYKEFNKSVDGIAWIAGMFHSDKDVVQAIVQRLDAEARVRSTQKQEFITATNNDRNNLDQDNQQRILEKIYSAQTNQSTPAETQAAVNRQPAEAQSTQEQLPDNEVLDLKQIFEERVQGDVNPNQKYFVKSVPDNFQIPDAELVQLETRESYFAPYQQEDTIGTNKDVTPFVWDLKNTDQRYQSAVKLTDDDVGLLGLAAASAENPEEQRKLLLHALNTVLQVHSKNPNLLKEWWDAQSANSAELFVDYDLDKDRVPKSENDRLVIKTLPNGSELPLTTQELVQRWNDRIAELRQKIDNNQLARHHLRWLEFLSHSVKVADIMDKMKQQSGTRAASGPLGQAAAD